MRAARAPRPAFIYLLLLLLNVAVYAWQQVVGTADADTLQRLVASGANIAPLTLTGEPARLVSSMFLHAGVLHLVLNMYMLFACGAMVEKAFGPIRFALAYLVSGMFGGLLSALWYAHHTLLVATTADRGMDRLPLVVSVGASGALMGIAGAWLAQWLVVDRTSFGADAHHMRRALVQTVVLTLLMGFLLPAVDNAAHIGGLLAGMALGALLTLADKAVHGRLRALASAAVFGACLLLLAATLRLPPPPALLQLKAALLEQLRLPAPVGREDATF